MIAKLCFTGLLMLALGRIVSHRLFFFFLTLTQGRVEKDR